MKRIRLRRPSPAMVVALIALVGTLGGTAIAHHGKAGVFKLANFQPDSRDRLAGTGVIQYAGASFVTPATVDSFNTVHRFEVKCELSKKATSGGFKWTGQTPNAGHYQVVDAYPTGQGFVVRLQLRPDDTTTPDVDESSALGKPLAVYANCVKSRRQRGAPPV
ncbi:MAG: hypothetical protein ACRDL6_08335 [Solirubrobacterales bacterium]